MDEVKRLCERLAEFRLRWQESGDLTYLGGALSDAVAGLSTLSRELAEARDRIATLEWERNTWDAAHTRQAQETRRQEARALAAEAASASKDERIAALEKALEPLARLEIPRFPQGNAGAYSIRHEDIRRARALSPKEPT